MEQNEDKSRLYSTRNLNRPYFQECVTIGFDSKGLPIIEPMCLVPEIKKPKK